MTVTSEIKLRKIVSLGRNKLFAVLVFFPTFLSIIYYGLIATDIFVSESRFVVRSPEKGISSPIGMMLKGAGLSKAEDDSYVVQDYILSRDALRNLDKTLDIKKSFSDDRADMFSRFALFGINDSFEDFYSFYLKKVTVQVDSTSAITTLISRAFSPMEANKINKQLLYEAEVLVNRLNDTAHSDLIRSAANEVESAQERAKVAGLALAKYRQDKGVIDPERQSALPLQQIVKLQEQQMGIRAQIQQLERVAKENPQLPILRQQLELIDHEIKTQQDVVAGLTPKSLAGKAPEYQRLMLEFEFANKMLASSMNTLEQARIEAQRKQFYLQRIVEPTMPDKALEPRRAKSVISIFLIGIFAYGILSMLIAGIKEHQD